jgi:hypothetical protein
VKKRRPRLGWESNAPRPPLPLYSPGRGGQGWPWP